MKTQALHVNKRNSSKSSLSSLILIILLMPLLFSSALFAETEPNNTCTSANMLLDTNSATDSGWVNGEVVGSSDNDWYKIVVTEKARIRFDRNGRNGRKTKAKLFESDCITQLGTWSSNASGDRHTRATLTAGTYYLKVWYSNHNNAKYKVRASYDPEQGGRDFSLFRQNNINGGMKIIGNSVKLDSTNGGQCAPNNTNNNNINGMYADMDSDSNTFNSTSANLVLPANVKSEDIEYALLNWQGRTGSPRNSLNHGITVKVKAFGQTSYQTTTTMLAKFDYFSHDYQGMQDITGIIKQSIDDANQTVIATTGYDKPFWVADVYAPIVGNGYGAWSLIVVYKDSSATLKNISVYDGFISVYNETIPTTLTGFITPSSGIVNSEFFVFAGEGDISLNDSVTLTDKNGNDVSLGSNIFKSSIDNDGANITNRTPSCQNTIGVDVRSFTVGTNGAIPIIGNSQTETTIKLKSTGDLYLPGLFAFSTDLYEPRVCYKQEFTDENGDPLQSPSVGDTIMVKTWISNMKKDAADGNLEPADKVEVELFFDSDNLEYIPNTTSIKNIGETSYINYLDTNQTGLADHFVDTNSSRWRVGTGASSTDGGLVNPNATGQDSLKAYVELKTKLLQDGNVTVHNVYKVSYLNTQLNLYFGHINMPECADMNASLNVLTIAGAFNAVSTSFTGTNDPLDGTDSINALTTQISNKPFSVKIISLASNNTDLTPYTGDVNVSIVNTPAFILGDDAGNKLLCDGATPINAPQLLHFTNEDRKDLNVVNTTRATQSAIFKIKYTAGSEQKFACSRDVFAIRPYSFKTFGKNQYKRAGEDFNITIKGVDETNDALSSGLASSVTGVVGYNASLNNLNITSTFYTPTPAQISIMQGNTGATDVTTCPVSGIFTIGNPSATFTNGEVNASLKFDETGILDLNISEKSGSEWAIVDASDTSDTQRYIKPSTQSFDEGNISQNTILAFVPYKFDTTATYGTTNSQDWLYMYDINKSNSTSTTPAMAAFVSYTITAKNKNGNTVQNYTKTCFPDIEEHNPYIPGSDCPQVNGLKLNTTFDLFLDANISITKDANISLYTEDMNNSSAIFTSHKNMQLSEGNNSIRELISPLNFTAGVGKAKVYFNIDKNNSITINPIKIEVFDANTSTSWMTNSGSPKAFNGTTIDQNTTFYYGRVHAPDQRFDSASGTAKVYYEVYCDGCIKTDFNITGDESIDSINWFTNKLHNTNTSNGVVYTYAPFHVTPSNPSTVSSGESTVDLQAPSTPYTDKVIITPDLWLIYNQFDSDANTTDFMVEFFKRSDWAGQGKKGRTVDLNISVKQNKRLNW